MREIIDGVAKAHVATFAALLRCCRKGSSAIARDNAVIPNLSEATFVFIYCMPWHNVFSTICYDFVLAQIVSKLKVKDRWKWRWKWKEQNVNTNYPGSRLGRALQHLCSGQFDWASQHL